MSLLHRMKIRETKEQQLPQLLTFILYLDACGLIMSYRSAIYGCRQASWYCKIEALNEPEAIKILKSRLKINKKAKYDKCEFGQEFLVSTETYKIPTTWGTKICSKGHYHDLGEYDEKKI